MGTIVSLPAKRRHRRVSVQSTNEATILLFMGVRYVRDFEPEKAAERVQPASARGHDAAVLELA